MFQMFFSSGEWTVVPPTTTTLLLLLYMSMEFGFYVLFRYYIVPRVNQRTAPRPYRDYRNGRHRLLVRILNRVERACRVHNRRFVTTMETFIKDWFQDTYHHHNANSIGTNHHHHKDTKQEDDDSKVDRIDTTETSFHKLPILTRASSISSAEGSELDEQQQYQQQQHPLQSVSEQTWTMDHDLCKDEMDDFLAWAFFGKDTSDLEDWEWQEMEQLYQILHSRLRLLFVNGRSKRYKSRRLTLEDVNPLHRPLVLYSFVAVMKWLGDLVLHFLFGYRRHVTSTGLVYWFRHCVRKDKPQETYNLPPLLFFHGIAPCSLLLYLPMLLGGLMSDDNRDVMLFETSTISCSLGFRALSEEETIQGVVEALRQCHVEGDLCLCGHSFGTCQLTWLLYSPTIRHRIRQLVLLDPVTILLSEPDVVVNFLYSRQRKQAEASSSSTSSWVDHWSVWYARKKIRLVASSEVFTEYYLRRHFSWYNSELWLEDIPPQVQVLVCLAERDEITNAKKIREELEIHNIHVDATKTSHVNIFEWKNKGHTYFLTSPMAWKKVKTELMQPYSTPVTKRSKCD